MTATWGRGPVNPAAFNCNVELAPQFGEKSFWVVTVEGKGLKFQEIADGEIKGLFGNLTVIRRDLIRDVSSKMRSSAANSNEHNVVFFFKEKNRKKWLEQGWLQPATTCVRHF